MSLGLPRMSTSFFSADKLLASFKSMDSTGLEVPCGYVNHSNLSVAVEGSSAASLVPLLLLPDWPHCLQAHVHLICMQLLLRDRGRAYATSSGHRVCSHHVVANAQHIGSSLLAYNLCSPLFGAIVLYVM